ncbi:MAG: RlpA-like double-psi beta-barrel domain-containing protein [Coriobacteriaceae bacterium]|nr:RlpA-like double-psi beta-barrel domain-containing protein [Coriobacteriaceae bacterium]
MSCISNHRSSFRSARAACAAGLALTLTLGGALGACPSPAFAATDATRAELSRLQEEVSGAASAFNDASARAQELDGKVDDIADEILHIEQELMPLRQKSASRAARDLYKTRTNSGGALSLLLNASSFEDFLNLNKYLSSVRDAHVSALEELDALEAELNGKLDELSKTKDKANAELARASEALGTAQSAAAKMQEKASAEDAAEMEMARKAAEQAAQLQAQHDASASKPVVPETSEPSKPNTDAGNGGDTTGQDQGGQQVAPPSQPDNSGGGSTQTPDNGGWLTGVASYYGIGDGFMGGTTASGEKVTETSMGVAMLNVPFGTRVEIRYGGRSVIAYVNDRGPYAHGRVIDMQPAVARALNFVSVGVGTVQYRFL